MSLAISAFSANANEPLPVAVIGLSHTHVHWLLGRENRGDLDVVAIVEPDTALAQRYVEQYGLGMEIVYDTFDGMIEHHRPVAVMAFGTIFDHLEVVEQAAPLGIHVMVEKPLAINMSHARRMHELAEAFDIHLLTNYETTWYPSTGEIRRTIDRDALGPVRKMVFHHGHEGPAKIGVNEEFLSWLIDPLQNGAGALTDFGCYGANLATWITDGQRPLSVVAITQQFQPELYPQVDDEATIVVTYAESQAIIQASWNWPVSRKDMEVYGVAGYVIADNYRDMRLHSDDDSSEHSLIADVLTEPYDNPFSYFAAVIRGDIEQSEFGLSSLENNMQVVEILDAARESAESGRVVRLPAQSYRNSIKTRLE